MPATMNLELDQKYIEQINEVAAALRRTPESVAQEVLAGGMHMVQRYAYLKAQSESADIGKAIEFLRSPRNNNPPDPGDELPEDLKYLIDAQE